MPLGLALALTVGVQGGIDLARIQTDADVDSAYVAGPVFGAQAALTLAEPLALRVELDYLRKNGRVTTGGPAGATTDYALGYLAVPVNLRYELGAGATSAYVFAGSTRGALVSARSQRAGAASVDVKGDLHGVEVTLDLGFGVGYRLGAAVMLVFDVRYSLGLNQVAADRAALDTSSWTSRSIQMVAGATYTFGAGEPAVTSVARAP